MDITLEQLKEIMPKMPEDKRTFYLPFLNRAMGEYEINTPLRAAAFLAQIAHESGECKYLEELWGPTDQQKKYEPPSSVAKKLGNTEKGDGFKYRGRGVIQLTGRANYARYGKLLGLDLVGNPSLAATPAHAFTVAALYWRIKKLNALADVGDFVGITKKINGGTNGLDERTQYYVVAMDVLGAPNMVIAAGESEGQ